MRHSAVDEQRRCDCHDIRGLKDRMSREIIDTLDEAKIGIASGTYEIVGMPTIRVETDSAAKQVSNG